MAAKAVKSRTGWNFGIVIAYLLPGFVILCGLGFLSDAVATWLLGAGRQEPTIGGFLYVTIASLAAGMLANAFRWALIDALHFITGLQRPNWNDAVLAEKLDAFERLVEDHYRYYQFYGNLLIAILAAFGCWRASTMGDVVPLGPPEIGVALVIAVLFAGSRDALRRYYRRTAFLLGTSTPVATDRIRKPEA